VATTSGTSRSTSMPALSTSSTGSMSPCASPFWPTWPRACARRHPTRKASG
jgi:hypothetical protein